MSLVEVEFNTEERDESGIMIYDVPSGRHDFEFAYDKIECMLSRSHERNIRSGSIL